MEGIISSEMNAHLKINTAISQQCEFKTPVGTSESCHANRGRPGTVAVERAGGKTVQLLLKNKDVANITPNQIHPRQDKYVQRRPLHHVEALSDCCCHVSSAAASK